MRLHRLQVMALPARFRVLSELGRGGMGTVLLVYDEDRGEPVALKRMLARGPTFDIRIKREYRALQELRHPNLVRLHELGDDAEGLYFTMEAIRGVDLFSAYRGLGLSVDDRTEAGSALASVDTQTVPIDDGATAAIPRDFPSLTGPWVDVERLRALVAQLIGALAYLHAREIVHRDLFRKSRALDDNIAEGVADGSNDFLALCVGRGAKRRVNLVLCGHNHSNIEYRLRLDAKTGELEYYVDYYSGNPSRYYNSREFEAGAREVAIKVDAGVKEPGPLVEVREQRPDDADGVAVLRRTVPANVETLAGASDRSAWWEARSPLIVQTPDRNQRAEENAGAPIDASFHGVRVIEVRADVVHAIRTVTLHEIQTEVATMPVLRAAG